jgi:hypothetical protein
MPRRHSPSPPSDSDEVYSHSADDTNVFTQLECDDSFYDYSSGDDIPPPPRNAHPKPPAGPSKRSCFRCGRTGHFIGSCYAKTRLDGTQLPRGRLSSVSPPPTPKKPRPTPGIYALQDSSGRIYVGKSNDKAARIKQHQNGQGTTFLSPPFAEIPLSTGGRQEDLETWERNETLSQMHLKGIDQVRGWMFTSPILSPAQKNQAYQQVCEKFDLCRKCGRHTHFANECYARSMAYWAE